MPRPLEIICCRWNKQQQMNMSGADHYGVLWNQGEGLWPCANYVLEKSPEGWVTGPAYVQMQMRSSTWPYQGQVRAGSSPGSAVVRLSYCFGLEWTGKVWCAWGTRGGAWWCQPLGQFFTNYITCGVHTRENHWGNNQFYQSITKSCNFTLVLINAFSTQ